MEILLEYEILFATLFWSSSKMLIILNCWEKNQFPVGNLLCKFILSDMNAVKMMTLKFDALVSKEKSLTKALNFMSWSSIFGRKIRQISSIETIWILQSMVFGPKRIPNSQ